MAGSFAIRLLAEGQLPNTKQTLYTVPGATSAVIKTISIAGTGTPATINLYIKKSGGTSRRIIPMDMALGGTYLLETDEEYTLETGDEIEGDSSVATSIDYSIHGIEET